MDVVIKCAVRHAESKLTRAHRHFVVGVVDVMAQ